MLNISPLTKRLKEPVGRLCKSTFCVPQRGEEMLYLVGLGLGDAKDITVKGLEIVKSADYVFLEAYTSILSVGQQVLVGIPHYHP